MPPPAPVRQICHISNVKAEIVGPCFQWIVRFVDVVDVAAAADDGSDDCHLLQLDD